MGSMQIGMYVQQQPSRQEQTRKEVSLCSIGALWHNSILEGFLSEFTVSFIHQRSKANGIEAASFPPKRTNFIMAFSRTVIPQRSLGAMVWNHRVKELQCHVFAYGMDVSRLSGLPSPLLSQVSLGTRLPDQTRHVAL